MPRPNRLKRRLAAGEQCLATWVFSDSADMTELLSLVGFDALIVDHEHIAASIRSLVDLLRAAQATDTTVVVRVPSHDPVYIKRVLDAGVGGLIVPTLETAEQARQIVAACRYRPHGGHRGVGYPEARAADWGLAEVDYPRSYREAFWLAGLIETRRGFENLPEILSVEGFDAMIPGPGDLAADLIDDFAKLTAFGSYRMPELDRILGQGEARIREAGLKLVAVTRDTAGAKAALARGYDLVTVGADTFFLMDAARAALAELKGGG